MKSDKKKVYLLTATALMTALTCVLAPLSIPLPFTPVPITLTNFVIYITAYILPWKYCTASCGLYLLLGLAGLPVFSGFGSGPGKLAGPTGGYLIGFLFTAAICGWVNEHLRRNRIAEILGMVAGLLAAYAFGTLWFLRQQHMSMAAALAVCVLPFLAGDVCKITAASIVGPVIRERLKKTGLV